MNRDEQSIYHPPDELLWDYHRGALPPGLALVVAAHLDGCPRCRDELEFLDIVGGSFLDDFEGVAVSSRALDLALARTERPEEPAPAKPAMPGFLTGLPLPESVRSAVVQGRYWAAPGVWMAPIRLEGAEPTDKTYLMSIKAGMVMPEHTHHGNEVTMILKGRFADAFGEYGPGDFMRCDAKIRHSPAMIGDEDCLCLVWQDAPIRPLTWLGKLLQPLARI